MNDEPALHCPGRRRAAVPPGPGQRLAARAFWGQDLEPGEGKQAERRKKLMRRRLQIGTAGFLIAGATFAAFGLSQVLWSAGRAGQAAGRGRSAQA